MADFSTIRAGIKTRLDTINNLRAKYTNVPEQVVCPAAFIAPEGWDYHEAMGTPGISKARFTVTVLASPLEPKGYSRAQDKLDSFLDDSGSDSIKAAIEGDKTLGGAVTTTTVLSVRDYGVVEWAGASYVGANILVEVWT